MNLTYKNAAETDIPLIADLAEQIWNKYYISIISREQIDYMLKKMYSAESLLTQMKNGEEFTLVYLDAQPVGYISISTRDKRNYFLHKFYIKTNDQAKGIGSSFLLYIEERLKEPETIELTVNRQNYKSINFYFKNGFVIKEVVDFDIGNGYFMNDFVMIKKIRR